MEHINLHAELIAVYGANRSAIYDLNRKNYFLIPNELFQILKKFNGKSIKKVYKKYYEYKKEIDEYFEFLNKNEIIFFSEKNERKFFPKINLFWDYPAIATNAIFRLGQNLDDVFRLMKEIEKLFCYHVQIVSKKTLSVEYLNKLYCVIENTAISSVEVYMPFSTNIFLDSYEKLLHTSARYKLFVFYFADETCRIFDSPKTVGKIFKVKQNLLKNSICGNINHNYFNVNITLLTESQHYNTCLNRKICIDENGEIKNCPAMKRSFGNIKDTTLEEAINKPGFKDLWGIRKDDIDVCKDCEFRYMCTDCRAFIKDPDNIYSQPAKCPYNPYIAKWEGEDGYITVEQWRSENPKWEKKARRYPLVKKPQPVE